MRRVRSSRRSPNRYEHPTPGAMVHSDVKKLGQYPGRRWMAPARPRRRNLSCQPAQKDPDRLRLRPHRHRRPHPAGLQRSTPRRERSAPAPAFLHRAMAWFAAHGVRVRRMLTDNAMVYRRGTDWGWSLFSLADSHAASPNPAAHGPTAKQNASTAPCSTNGPTPAPWTSNSLRARGLDRFLRHYNTRRGHSALGGQPPISRLAA